MVVMEIWCPSVFWKTHFGEVIFWWKWPYYG